MYIDENEPPSIDFVLAKMLARIKHKDKSSTVENAVRHAWDVSIYARRIRWALWHIRLGRYGDM